jgi:hypothetical protein
LGLVNDLPKSDLEGPGRIGVVQGGQVIAAIEFPNVVGSSNSFSPTISRLREAKDLR